MRRVPGLIINGGGGVISGAVSGLDQYPGRVLRWANPVRWDASRYTRVLIDAGYASLPDMTVQINNAQDGDRLVCSMFSSAYGLATNLIFTGVNIGPYATVQDRLVAQYTTEANNGKHPKYAGPVSFQAESWGTYAWMLSHFFFLKTKGQLYLTRCMYQSPEMGIS